MPGPFKRFDVDIHFNPITTQAVFLSWAMAPEFTAPSPWTFTLYRGVAPTDDAMEPIASVVDVPWIYDNRPIANMMDLTIYYRITLTDAAGATYNSDVFDCKSYWSRYDWSIAREITRKENLLLTKKVGTKGYLLKRRYFGTVCPVCTDPVLKTSNQSQCPSCFGVGFTGGYYPALECWLTLNATQFSQKLTENGLLTHTSESARGLAYPSPSPNDVWVNAHSNIRYFVASDTRAVARLRGIDLVVEFNLTKVAPNHAIYGVPTPSSAGVQ